MPTQTLNHRYDSAGRLTSVDDSYLSGLFSSGCANGTSRCFGSVAPAYDPAGNLTGLTLYGAGGTSYAQGFQYDVLNRLKTLTQDSVAQAIYSYNPQGFRTSALTGDGNTTSWTYYTNGDLASITQPMAGSTTTSWNLTYNGAHQILSEGLSDNSFENGDTNPGNTYAVNVLNQYTTVNGVTQADDKNGNLISDGTWTYQYDEENRLRQASGPGTAQYDYDPLGRRRAKLANGVVTFYTSDGAEEVAEWSTTGALNTRYGNGITTDDHVTMFDYTCATPPCRYYYHTDWHGSTVILGNQTGGIAA